MRALKSPGALPPIGFIRHSPVAFSSIGTHTGICIRRLNSAKCQVNPSTEARDFRVLFLSDGTATFSVGDLSAAALQKATCATLGRVFAQVLTVDEIIAKIELGVKLVAAQA